MKSKPQSTPFHVPRSGSRIMTGLILCLLGLTISHSQEPSQRQISEEALRDKIRGGLLGQILGNLNGLEHEMKYIDQPGSVDNYIPSLPNGAWTDDDTDFEWVYIMEMQRQGEVLLSPEFIQSLWKSRINRRIWCSNQYARQLMDLDMLPPETGLFVYNPWAEFNISGQFLCETFGLLAPGLPQTAARIGLNYTRVAIDMEPAQTTQLFTSMIAMAFFEPDLDRLMDLGIQALDPQSQIHEILNDIRNWHAQFPEDWTETRQRLKQKYSKHGGAMRDRNGYELNTGVTIAALLYGKGDLPKTLQTAFNFGWDCDNSAATAGTILGVIQGYRGMMSQGWQIVDRYKNVTRQNMPEDETITSFADRILDLSKWVLTNADAQSIRNGASVDYTFKGEVPRCILPLAFSQAHNNQLRQDQITSIRKTIVESNQATDLARSAYQALCLNLDRQLKMDHPTEWTRALEALNRSTNILQVLFHHSDIPAAEPMRIRFRQGGVIPPQQRRPLWE